MTFRLLANDPHTRARRGLLRTARGEIQTPVFMPVGTQATVKTMSPDELEQLGAEIILGNTYHLYIRPGTDIVRGAGGLHQFMGWPHSILTDSGGYQIFSLSKLRRVTPDGVHFQSHVDGNAIFLGPVEALAVQRELGSDIAMVLDECTPYPATREEAETSLELTLRWARTCREQTLAPGQLLFGIVQGGMHRELRERAAAELAAMGFDGLAIGGLSVGEPNEQMLQVLDWTIPALPETTPHYLMGVGTPAQIVAAVARGIDMFDCVLPTRVGRNGSAYTAAGTIPVKAGRFKDDYSPIDGNCSCYACQHFSRAYIRHLLNVNEMLGMRLMTTHNLHFYLQLMARIRQEIETGTFRRFHDEFLAGYEARGETGTGGRQDEG